MRPPSKKGHAKYPPDGMVKVRGVYPEPCICLDACTIGPAGHVESCLCLACYWMTLPIWILASVPPTSSSFRSQHRTEDRPATWRDEWADDWEPDA